MNKSRFKRLVKIIRVLQSREDRLIEEALLVMQNQPCFTISHEEECLRKLLVNRDRLARLRRELGKCLKD